jgi:hypothetical protein
MTEIVKLTKSEKYMKYYKENKAQVNIWRQMEVTCECGAVVQAQHLSIHQKTKLHQKRLRKMDSIIYEPRGYS